MIVGFSKHGTGGSKGPIQYLTGTHSPDGTKRDPAPVVLRGDPALVGRLIDSLDFKHKYTSGVLSFAPGEIVTDAMAERIMDAFERTAFAGLERDQYSILWVKHLHADHVELNFLVPRVELSTGKSLNIAPPGQASRELFDTFRSMVNAQFGLADPEDVTRARDVSLPNHLARLRAAATRKGQALDADMREAITEYVRREVDAGRVKDRNGVEAFLKTQGFTIPRAGDDYLTVLDPESGKRLRLRGGLYNRERFNPADTAYEQVRYGVPDPERAAALAASLERQTAARARYHRERYGRPGDAQARTRTPSGLDLSGPGGDALADRLREQLGDAAIVPHPDELTQARSSQRRRRRQRQHAAAGIGKEQDDIPGGRALERVRAFGETLSGARARAGAEFARLAAAGRELERASQRISATGTSFAASLSTWLEQKWWERFYGDPEHER